MREISIKEYFESIDYPGRTILIAVNEDKTRANIVYFIMGRSENSKNRVFVKDGESVKTQAFDPSKLEDPTLIIYPVYKAFGNTHIVTNGDQTQTIFEFLNRGESSHRALLTRDYEPDAPNFTPRISCVLNEKNYEISIIKSFNQEGSDSSRFFYTYPISACQGHLIHTYMGNGNPLPTFEGEPKYFTWTANMGKLVWDSINPEYKISLLDLTIDLVSGKATDLKIYNKNGDENEGI
ncbi:IMP cyclohydrolase [Peptoniphilaceae bacterium SGI.131]